MTAAAAKIRHPDHPFERTARLRDGTVLTIRSIAPSDAARERAFLACLPAETRGHRFLGLIKDPSESVARELTAVDPATSVSLVGIVRERDREREVGTALFSTSPNAVHCDCAVAVAPDWQQRGVGTALMMHLIEAARRRGIRRMYAADAARCKGAHSLAERLGFRPRPDPEDPVVTTHELALAP